MAQDLAATYSDLRRRQHPNNLRRAVAWGDGWLPAGMHIDRLRAQVKTLHDGREGRSRSQDNRGLPSIHRARGQTRAAALERFRQSQMHRHLVSLRKSTLKDQGAASDEESNLIGTPAEIVNMAIASEAGVTHLLPLFRGA
jgi:alkanesulfonate monooxygenase SsuD/methylene tetrahydromethanopterin reductase-like flavin-dependent oxidoreductase (luciferase family)